MEQQTEPVKAIWMYADLEISPIGTASRLAEPMQGVPVLTRTLNRLLKVTEFDVIVVFCPESQADDIKHLIPASDRIMVQPLTQPVKSLAAKYRKWSLSSWRGGLGELTCFDEDKITREMIQFAAKNNQSVFINCPAAAPLIDPVFN